jgi:hypothetical protein
MAADIVGLYLSPPQDAIVLAVDEKPHIQALERAQGYLKLPSGRALSGRSHDYKRNGTSTLFAALELATGQVTAGHYKRRRRVEFLDLMNGVVADYPGKQIHVILDNLSTHKPKARSLVGPTLQCSSPLHPDLQLLSQPDQGLVLHPSGCFPRRRKLLLRPTTQRAQRCLRPKLQPPRCALRLDQVRGPSKTTQITFLGLMIPGTSRGTGAAADAEDSACRAPRATAASGRP